MPQPDDTSQYANERILNAKVKLRYDLITPGNARSPLLIALHGYGANKRQMMREAKQIAPSGFAIASLQGFHQHLKDPKEEGGPLRYGFGWLTNFHPEDSIALHHNALLDLIATLVDEGTVDGSRTFLLGFSQSCALNYRFAFTHSTALRGVVGICGGLPGDWDSCDRYEQTKAAVFHLSGKNDEFYSPERVANYAEQLRRRSSDVEFKSYDAGHEITQPMRDDIRTWLAQHSGPENTQ